MGNQISSGKEAAGLLQTPDRHDRATRKRAAKPRAELSDDRSWSVQDVAYFLNVSESTVRNLEREGKLPSLPRIGTRIIFDPRIVRAFRDGWRSPARGRTSGSAGMFLPLPDSHREQR